MKNKKVRHFQTHNEEHMFFVEPCTGLQDPRHKVLQDPAVPLSFLSHPSLFLDMVSCLNLCRERPVWFHFPFALCRDWILRDSLHTCSLGFVSSSWSHSHSSDSSTGTESFITRSLVRLLVSIYPSSSSLRLHCSVLLSLLMGRRHYQM